MRGPECFGKSLDVLVSGECSACLDDRHISGNGTKGVGSTYQDVAREERRTGSETVLFVQRNHASSRQRCPLPPHCIPQKPIDHTSTQSKPSSLNAHNPPKTSSSLLLSPSCFARLVTNHLHPLIPLAVCTLKP